MSFVKSEESAKAAKLVGAIVVVFGLAAWRVAGAMGPPPKPAATTETVGAATPVAPAASATTTPAADAKPEDDAVRLPKLVVASNLNPFRTIAPTEGPATPVVAPPATPIPTLSGTPTGPLAAAPLTVAPPATARPVPARPAPPAWTPLRVTGILAGPNGTAVLELGSDSRVVSVGARLADGTVVLRIDPATVTVRRGKETQTLDVGE